MTKPNIPTDRLLTTAEAAEILSLRPQTLHEWRSTGKQPGLRFCKLGGSVRYRLSDVQAFIEEATVGEPVTSR